MNSRPTLSIPRLAAGASRTGIRWLSAKPKEYTRWEDHAEKIFVIRHIEKNHVVYSFTPTLSHSLLKRQIPFNGKKLFPATIRKDYWDTMAVIELPKGQGDVGQSVVQRLREFRKRHELEWNEPLFELSKRERGEALNDQKANSVADIAAVLGGAGKGNLIVAENRRQRRAGRSTKNKGLKARSEEAAEVKTDEETTGKAEETKADKTLSQVTVFWRDLMDAAHAQAWSDNVTHTLLGENTFGQTYRRKLSTKQTPQPEEEAAAPEPEVTEPKATEPKAAAPESI